MRSSIVASIIGSLTIMVVTAAMAEDSSGVRNQGLNRNVFYRLTPETAKQLNLDYAQILKDMHIQSDQDILFKINENDELDLSIFNEKVFAAAREDIRSS